MKVITKIDGKIEKNSEVIHMSLTITEALTILKHYLECNDVPACTHQPAFVTTVMLVAAPSENASVASLIKNLRACTGPMHCPGFSDLLQAVRQVTTQGVSQDTSFSE